MKYIRFLLITALLPQLIQSVHGADIRTPSLITTSTRTLSGNQSPSPTRLLAIKNRAKTYSGELSGDMTRHVYIDPGLRGKMQDEVLRSLSPVIAADDPARAASIYLESKQTLTIFAVKDEPVHIGAAIVEGSRTKPLTIDSNIVLKRLVVIGTK